MSQFDSPPQPGGHTKTEFLDFYGDAKLWNESVVVARDDAQDRDAALKVSIPWHKFLAIINAKLKDPSARSLLETTVSLRRDDNCDLHTWVRTFIMTQELCGQKKISLPYSVWYSYFIHQLTSKEKALPIPLPKTEAAANEYDLRTYETALYDLNVESLPQFRKSSITKAQSELMIHPSRVQELHKMIRDLKSHCQALAKALKSLGKNPPATPGGGGADRAKNGGRNGNRRRTAKQAGFESHVNETQTKKRIINCNDCGIDHPVFEHNKSGIAAMRKRWKDRNDLRSDPRFDPNDSDRKRRFKVLQKIAKSRNVPMAPPGTNCNNCNKPGHFARHCPEPYKKRKPKSKGARRESHGKEVYDQTNDRIVQVKDRNATAVQASQPSKAALAKANKALALVNKMSKTWNAMFVNETHAREPGMRSKIIRTNLDVYVPALITGAAPTVKKVITALDSGSSVPSAARAMLHNVRPVKTICPPIKTSGGIVPGYEYEGDLLTKHHIAGTKITTVYVTESGSRPHECQVALSTDLTINDFGFSIDGLGREAMKSGYNVVHEPIISAIPLGDAKQQLKVYVTDHAGDEVPAFWDGTSRPWHGIALAPVTFLDGTTRATSAPTA